MGRKNSFFSLKSASLRTSRGLTLSEVLVVIAILGILILLLAFFIRPNFQIGKARDSERKSDLQKLAIALEDYATDHKCYPKATEWEGALEPKYLPKVFKDPKTKQSYTYVCPAEDCSNGTGCTMFAIFTTLESEPGTSYSNGNYVVTSPNYSLATPGSCTQSAYYGCFSGVCTPLCRDCNAAELTLDPNDDCCEPNYAVGPSCNDKCKDPDTGQPTNQCVYQ